MRPSLQFLMLSCKKATFLADKKLEVNLSWTEGIQLKLHTSICDGCKTYLKQSLLLEQTLNSYFQKMNNDTNPVVENIELKEKLLRNI